MSNETLWKNEWLEVRNKDGWYTHVHSPVGDGTGVAILGFRDNNGTREYLGRYEHCPAHSDDIELCSLTGMCDKKSEDRKTTALRELTEESGYIVKNASRVIELGSVMPSKASDVEVFLFAVEIKEDDEQIDVKSDGTKGEEGAYSKWVNEKELVFCKDPIVSTLIMRLKYNV